jgi:hypothetical protein
VQLGHIGGGLILTGQLGECIVEIDQFAVTIRHVKVAELDAIMIAAVSEPLLSPSILDQNAPHRLGGVGEEVAPPRESLRVRGSDKAQISFVNESGGFQCLTRLLAVQALGREPPQLVVNKWKQFPRCTPISGDDGVE